MWDNISRIIPQDSFILLLPPFLFLPFYLTSSLENFLQYGVTIIFQQKRTRFSQSLPAPYMGGGVSETKITTATKRAR